MYFKKMKDLTYDIMTPFCTYRAYNVLQSYSKFGFNVLYAETKFYTSCSTSIILTHSMIIPPCYAFYHSSAMNTL